MRINLFYTGIVKKRQMLINLEVKGLHSSRLNNIHVYTHFDSLQWWSVSRGGGGYKWEW